MSESLVKICVVGAGPRGTIVLERICANAALLAAAAHVEVHVIDPHVPGAGRVWQTTQCRHLMTNTVASDVTVFTDDTVECDGPIRPGPSEYQWARMISQGNVSDVDQRTAEEAAGMRPWSYATRAFQGQYLSWAFQCIADTAPPQVTVCVHRRRAIAVQYLSDGRLSVRLSHRPDPIEADAVIMTQGHIDVEPRLSERRLLNFAVRHGRVYIPPANPAEVNLEALLPGEPVILRGLGLNFFDYVALLTVERGGRFSRAAGRLIYAPSGSEPLLCAGSGRGVPYLARTELREEIVPRYQPRFLDVAAVARLRSRATGGANDFMRDLFPLIAKEIGWVYYQHLLRNGPDDGRMERFTAEYAESDWGDERMDQLLEEMFPDARVRWDWQRLDRPARDQYFSDRTQYRSWVVDRLYHDFIESKLGPVGSAFKAASTAMRDLRNEIRQVLSYQGISGVSYRDHVDGWFSGLVNFFASGPPASRIEELIALAEAGVVSFLGPRMQVLTDEASAVFIATSPVVGDKPVRSRVLIEAHLPVTDVMRSADPLVRCLLTEGQGRPHVIPNPDGSGYQTGGLDVAEGSFRVVNASGFAHRALFACGPLIESVQWVTAVGARPHVGSGILLQGDKIARLALTSGIEMLRRRGMVVCPAAPARTGQESVRVA
jgi:uncharacterized NAD(P)/FAD-binding protein YdhS